MDINIQEVAPKLNIVAQDGFVLKFNGPITQINTNLSNYYTKAETQALIDETLGTVETLLSEV